VFISFFSDKFREPLKKLTKKDEHLKKRLLDQIMEMEKEPPFSQVSLIGDFTGKWKMRVGDYRLLYAYCQDCKKHKHQSYNNCLDCNTKKDNTLIFFEVFHRSNDYSGY
jgi:mRNA-degrading endonuclease RelE of RelBE toxin-antitoxin system